MTKPGIDADGVPENEADHFMKCPACSQWFDMRDLAQVVEHVHDSEIEVLEAPIPPPREVPRCNKQIAVRPAVFLS
jgi:hypothetical protein